MSASIPDTMRAVVLERPGTEGLTVRTVPVPEVGVDDVLVRVRACGIGRTVLNKVRGLTQDQLPRIPAHEAAGEIVALGSGVRGFEVGQQVLVYYYVTCGNCQKCWTGREPLCDEVAGRYLRVGEDRDGALAEYVRLGVRNVIAMPEGLDPVAATTAPDAIATPLHIVRRAALRAGETIMVIGAAGGVGVHLLQVARWMGARAVAVDVPGKLEALTAYGATELVDGTAPGWERPLTGRIDVAVDLVGTPETLQRSIDVLAPGGRLAVLTVDRDVTFPVAPFRMVGGELTIVGSKYANHAEVLEAARLLADGTLEAVVSHVVDLEGAPDVLRAIETNDFFARGAMRLDF